MIWADENWKSSIVFFPCLLEIINFEHVTCIFTLIYLFYSSLKLQTLTRQHLNIRTKLEFWKSLKRKWFANFGYTGKNEDLEERRKLLSLTLVMKLFCKITSVWLISIISTSLKSQLIMLCNEARTLSHCVQSCAWSSWKALRGHKPQLPFNDLQNV